jgi:hypothetical protein
MMSYIFCPNASDWPAFSEEVKVALGEADRPIWLGHFAPDGAWVPVCTVLGADGSCWTADVRLSEEQIAELRAWVPDKVQVIDKLPDGWKAKVVADALG